MKKIFFAIIALAAFVGCNTEVMEEVATTPQYLTASFEVDLNGESRAFDSDLKWSWESTDEIAAFQFAGEQTVNKLTLKDNGKFGTDEFKYATPDSSTFVFVYPFDAYDAEKQDVGYVQTGVWTPTLVGIVENATVNNIGTVEMKHMSAAFEIRVWDEGSNKDHKTPKTIKEAKITSKTDGGVSASLTNLSTNTVVFNVAGGEDKDKKVVVYDITLVDTNGRTYTVSNKELTFVNGQRTILNVEWNNLALEGVNSWYNEVSNGVDSKLEAGAIYLNGLSGKDAVVYVDGNPATVSDNVIYGVASGEHTVYAAYKSNKTAEYAVTVTGKPSISYTATTSYNNNAGTVLKNNTLTNGNEGKLLTISNYSCNIAAEDAPYFGTPVFVYGNNEMAPVNKSMELAVGQYNTYVKLPIGTSGYSLKYGQATMYVTGIPYSVGTTSSSVSGWTSSNTGSEQSSLLLKGSTASIVSNGIFFAPGNMAVNVFVTAAGYHGWGSSTLNMYINATESSAVTSGTKISVPGDQFYPDQAKWVEYEQACTMTSAKKNISIYGTISGRGLTGFARSIMIRKVKVEYK